MKKKLTDITVYSSGKVKFERGKIDHFYKVLDYARWIRINRLAKKKFWSTILPGTVSHPGLYTVWSITYWNNPAGIASNIFVWMWLSYIIVISIIKLFH